MGGFNVKKRRCKVPISVVEMMLGLVGKQASLETIKSWTPWQRESAANWAGREHLIASDNDHLKRLKCPPHVEKLPDIDHGKLMMEEMLEKHPEWKK
jgi:hypothetical protein